jgi:hypothetical protein
MVENQPLKMSHLFYPVALLLREAGMADLSNEGAFLNEKSALGGVRRREELELKKGGTELLLFHVAILHIPCIINHVI